MLIKQSEVREGGNCFIPRGRYRARCISTKYGKSQKGYDMTTLTCEVVSETVEVEGKTYNIAGKQFMICLMHVPDKDWGQARVYPMCRNLGIELPEEDDGMGGLTPVYDTDLHKEYFHGMEFDVILSSSEDVKRYEKKPGQSVGEPILDGEGNKISNGYRIDLVSPDSIPEYCNPEKNQDIASQPY